MSERRHASGARKLIDVPAYSVGLAAHYLQLPTSTVRYWTIGRAPYPPVVEVEVFDGPQLSFRNLLEVHVLSAITRQHQVRLPAVRKAIDYLRRHFGSRHPLIEERMLTDGKRLFVKRYGDLIDVSGEGQTAMARLVESHLKRIRWDERGVPFRLHPFTRPRPEGPELVMIDPSVQFGRPCITNTGIPTSVVNERFRAGDSVAHLARDYERSEDEIEEAIRYEDRPRAA